MKILHCLPGTGWGGAERVACTLHRLALGHGHESRVEGRFSPDMAAAFAADTGETLASASRERAAWKWALAARKRRREFQPDLVHAHLSTPSVASTLAFIAGSTPTVFTFHLLPLAKTWPQDHFLPIPSRTFLRWLLTTKTNALCVAVSRRDQTILAEQLRIRSVELAVNAPPYPPVHAPPFNGTLWTPGTLRLLSVGRLDHQKGFDQLLTALSAPSLRDFPFQWVILGEGGEHGRLQAQIQASPIHRKVQLLGAMPAHGAIAEANLVLCPSRFEGMPLVPLEAIAAGTPVVLSRIPSHLELLPGLEDAFFPEDTQAWPDALVRLLTAPNKLIQLQADEATRAPANPRQRWWRDYVAIYEKALLR